MEDTTVVRYSVCREGEKDVKRNGREEVRRKDTRNRAVTKRVRVGGRGKGSSGDPRDFIEVRERTRQRFVDTRRDSADAWMKSQSARDAGGSEERGAN